ncbi:MAG: glycosyltransferase family 39 protein [Patescibacteria group bacterium]
MLKKTNFLLITILIVGTALRLAAVFKYGNFWDDEMFSFVYSQKSWPQGLIYWLWETNPPLHLLILKIWFYIFPAMEFFARLPSLIAGMMTIYAVYILGRNIFNGKTALLAAFLLAVHPYHIFWSATARVYAVLVLLATISTIYYFRLFFGENTKEKKYPAAIINTLLLFSHLSAVFFLAGQFIALIIFKGKRSVIDWIKLNLFPFMFGAVWIVTSLIIKRGNDLEQSWFFNMTHNFKNLVSPFINITLGQYPLYIGVCFFLLFALLLGAAAIKKFKSRDINYFVLLTIALAPMFLSAVANVWHIKFFVISLPILVLLIAEALLLFFTEKTAAVIIIIIYSVGLFRFYAGLPLTDWNEARVFIATHQTGNSLFIYNNFILKLQIDKYLPKNISASATPLILYKNMDWDDMIVKKNYIFTSLNDKQKDDWCDENKLDSYDQIILLQGNYNFMTRLDDLLTRHGWYQKGEINKTRLNGNYYFYVYEKY